MRRTMILFIFLSILTSTTVYADSKLYELDNIFKNHGSVMLTIDPATGKILGANPAAEKFYGYSIDELINMNINEVNVLSDDEIKSEMDSALHQKRNYFVFKHKLKDGAIKDVEVYSSPATDEQGSAILFSIVHDITPRLVAEKEAQQHKIIVMTLLGILCLTSIIAVLYMSRVKKKEKNMKLRFQSLFDNMKEGFALHEIICSEDGLPVDYRFLEVNRAFESITGLKTEKIKNRTVKEVLSGTEEYWIEKYGEVALHGITLSFTNYSSELDKHFSVSVYSPKPNQFATIFTDVTEQVQAQEKVQLERKLLETILEDTLLGYWDWDLVSNEAYLSPSFKAMFGYEEHELENSPGTWQQLIFKEDLPIILDRFQQHVDSQGKIPFYNEVRYHHKNGSVVWVICSGRVVAWQGDKPIRMVGCHINITQIKKLEKQLRKERNLLKTTLHSLGDAVISTDKDGKIHLMNTVAENLTGWTNVEAKGIAFEIVFNIINEFTRTACENPVKKVFETGEIIELANHTILIKKNQEEIPIEDSASPIKDEKGNIGGAVIVFRDCTDKKIKQKKIQYLSYHDQLTGLYNRHFFEEKLTRFDTQGNLPFTIAMADVNGLKLTNDAFGHQVGDKLLKSVARILKSECRSYDIVARVGGDEFALLLPKTSRDQAEKIIKRIYKAVEEAKLDSIIISVSIGWDTKEHPDQKMREVFARAEEHMYRKKLTESQSMRNRTIKVIFKTLHETNKREKIHSERVSQLSRKIGEAMKLDSQTLNELEIAGLMHDIGKIAINENVLNKPGKLTESEYDEIKRHPEIGYHILKSVDTYTNLSDYVLSHHERWDGKGYPIGLSGKEIPLISRIITVADAYEAMTAERPYKESMSHEKAIQELKRCSGTQFDPLIVDVYISYFSDHNIIHP